jgi:hypothetical protein
MSSPGRPPTRIVVALGLSVVAAVVLAGNALLGGGVDAPGPPSEATTTSTSAGTEPVDQDPSTTVSLAPDWFEKGSSRYSARRTTTTTASEPALDPDGASSGRAGATAEADDGGDGGAPGDG